jgi:hypothetical protein
LRARRRGIGGVAGRSTQALGSILSIIELIEDAWNWTGIEPAEVLAVNAFGNLLIRDTSGRVWRLCPEDLQCEVVAENNEDLAALLQKANFIADWEMTSLVEIARAKLGPLAEGARYCLKIPGAMGGEYAESNLGAMSLEELICFSGSVARQIKDLPDGTPIKLTFTK